MPDTTTTLGVIAAVGTLLPVVTSLILRYGSSWSTRTRSIVAAVVSGVAGIVSYVAVNGLPELADVNNIALWAVGVYGLAQVAYQNFWKPVGAAGKLDGTTVDGKTVTGEVNLEDLSPRWNEEDVSVEDESAAADA